MRCDEFESRLQETLDLRRLPERDEQLREHADQCQHCADYLALQRQLFLACAHQRRQERRLRTGRSEIQTKGPSTKRRPPAYPHSTLSNWMTASAAGLLFLALGIAPWAWWQARTPVQGGRLVQTGRSVPSAHGNSNALLSTDSHLAVWQNLRQTLWQESGDQEESDVELQDELQPIKDSLRETLGGLRQLIPTPMAEPAQDRDRAGMTAIWPDVRMG